MTPKNFCPMCKSDNYNEIRGCKRCGFAGLCKTEKNSDDEF